MEKLGNRIDLTWKMEKLGNRIDLSNEKDKLKWTSIPSCISQNIFDNNLVAIRKSIHLHLRKSYINA